MIKVVLLFDKLVLDGVDVVCGTVEVHREGEAAVFHADADADLGRHAVDATVVERGVIGLHVVGEAFAAVEEVKTEVEFGPGINLEPSV